MGAGRMGQIRAKIIYGNPRMKLVMVVDAYEEAGSKLAALYESGMYISVYVNVETPYISTRRIC